MSKGTITHEPKPSWQPHLAIAAWAVPGLGHWLIGMKRRGVILFGGIMFLAVTGLAVGGIGVIDVLQPPEPSQSQNRATRRGPSILGMWQPLVGPVLPVWMFLKRPYDARVGVPPSFYDRPPYTPSFGRTYEMGVLYVALAGMLNLLAIMDVFYCDPEFRRRLDAGEVTEQEMARVTGQAERSRVVT